MSDYDHTNMRPTPPGGTPAQLPAQPTTKQLPAVQVPSDTLAAVLSELRAMRGDVTSLVTSVEVLTNQQVVFGQRLTLVEKRQDASEERATSNSMRAREASGVDLKHESAISNIIAEQAESKKRDEEIQFLISQNTDLTAEIRTSVLSAFKHPAVQALVFAAIAFATAWFTRHT